MNVYFRLIILIALIVNSSSCGCKGREEDKHPELPYFPETTETKIKFEKIHFDPDSFYKIKNLYFNIQDALDKKYPKDLHIFYYKEDLITVTNSIPLGKNNYFIDESGFLYIYNFHSSNNIYEVVKMDVRTGKKKKIENLEENYGEEYVKFFELNKEFEKQLTYPKDSVFLKNRSKIVDSVQRVISKKFRANTLTGLQKVKRIKLNSIDNTFLLQYKDKEVLLKDVPMWYTIAEEAQSPYDLLLNYTKYNELQHVVIEQTTNVTVFDDAIRGNHFGPGKLNFFLDQSGIQYCELNFKNEKARFKLEVYNLNKHNAIQTFIMPDKKTTILSSDKEQFKLSL